MKHRKVSIGLGFGVMMPTLWMMPIVWAHNVEIAGEVAGTWHVEPNHRPKAGEPAQVWVALTRQGGALLPLEQANCQFSVYNAPRQSGDRPILQPVVAPLSVEQYQGIPSTSFTFPSTGLYELTLACNPKTAGDFSPFEMAYAVTVATGSSISPSPVAASPIPTDTPIVSPTPLDTAKLDTAKSTDATENNLLLVWIGAVAVLLTLGFLWAVPRLFKKS
ncbi:MAG: hypothetical protein MUF72_08180 [Elainella sp. Prado103]|nr:hypothetical protein [Elainella sp. Prado103]